MLNSSYLVPSLKFEFTCPGTSIKKLNTILYFDLLLWTHMLYRKRSGFTLISIYIYLVSY